LKTLGNLTTKQTSTHIYRIISNPQKYIPRLEQQYKSVISQRNIVTTILAIYKYLNIKEYNLEESMNLWKEYHQRLATQIHTSNKTEHSNISLKEFKQKYEELKSKTSIHAKLRDSLILVFLAFVVYQNKTCKCTDLGNVVIIDNKVEHKSYPKDTSYISFNSSASSSLINLILPKSKSEIKSSLHKKFYKILKKSLLYHPRTHLFVQANMMPFEKSNSFNQFVLRSTKSLFGQQVGMNVIRYFYDSSNSKSY
jgi:hypothetical protein